MERKIEKGRGREREKNENRGTELDRIIVSSATQ